MSNSKVEFLRKGNIGKAIAEMLASVDKEVTVGVHSDANVDYPETGVSVAQVGLFQEFGTPNAKHPTPERSFLRSTAKREQKATTDFIVNSIIDKLQNPASKKTFDDILKSVGVRMTFAVQNTIRSNIAPENAPSTLARKLAKGHGNRTLIDTGLLLRSISFKIGPKNSQQ